jgi:hypothetical protein
MKLLIRILALLLVVPATYLLVYWLPFLVLPIGENRWLASTVSLLCAIAASWFVWKTLGAEPHGLISSVIVRAILLGGVGFTLGFFGPMILFPDANQGPLLGIFITGPLGFLLGALSGAIYWSVRDRKAQSV